MAAAAPRRYMPNTRPGAAAAWSAFGLPQDRLARIAARRHFVQLKQGFMQAAAQAAGSRGDWLRTLVRQANDPMDLWLLRGAVFAALPSRGPETQQLRTQLHRMLDSVFPDSSDDTVPALL